MNSEDEERESLETWQVVLVLVPLCSIAVWIVLSNAFVILAVVASKSMRTPPNIYLASLASTDFLVGMLILPFNILQIVKNYWMFSEELCKTWLTLDVTLSTLSIFHLIAIAVDRYRAVSDGVAYVLNRTIRDVVSVVICLWIVCLWIATPPILGWGSWNDIKLNEKFICEYSTTFGYVIHSAFGSFIFPMILMITIYLKIFGKIQQKFQERAAVPSLQNSIDRELSETETSGDLLKTKRETQKVKRMNNSRPTSQIQEFVTKKIRFSLTKERRAVRTLGIIIGSFMICWLPFCIMYIIRPKTGDPPIVIYHLLTWLGYLNSAVNPIIYCVCSKDFKRAFNRFFCRRNRNNHVL
ncbi:putative G-protein coupled receptor No18 [Orchesella cincta]|uniref:Putative G-protein coupled receptor No18 n=1 Tax=Orchesella cincta TaxID=48709 RepID=A0A1D2MK30_ORCCI|nr:putative G-protein coupled receptor No18 [Orchesella cincta]